ncbi:MAG: methyltransferase domain-containing protein [Gaiellales bacterium]
MRQTGDVWSIDWIDHAESLRCRLCGKHGAGRAVAEFKAPDGVRLTAIECSSCHSLEILDAPLTLTDDETAVDAHVEANAGIGTMLELIATTDGFEARRLLDIGCGYGFAVAAARDALGWEAIGIEPSLAGRRGRTELGVNIVVDVFEADADYGDPFDLILASEVVEHLPDPLPFLEGTLRKLASAGTLRLSTPAREVVQQDQDGLLIRGALSPGYHCFVASEDGLRRLLRRAGYSCTRVWRDGGTLRAVAGSTPEAVRGPDRPKFNQREVESWFRSVMNRAPDGSALRLGMATRLLRSIVARGDFVSANAVADEVQTQLERRYGIAIDDPSGLDLDADGAHSWAGVLPGVSYALGMRELLHTEDAAKAGAYFDLGLRAVHALQRWTGMETLDMAELRRECAYHRVLANTRTAPDAAAAETRSLLPADGMPDERLARIFVELMARDESTAAMTLVPDVAAVAHVLAQASDPTKRRSGLDSIYMLGIAAAKAGQNTKALSLFVECEGLCLDNPVVDGHAVELSRSCAASAASMRTALGETSENASSAERSLRRRILAETTHASPIPEVHANVDTYWRDAHGSFIEGWAHLGHVEFDRVRVIFDTGEADAEQFERSDLRAADPRIPASVAPGFRAYVAGAAGREVALRLTTADGAVAHLMPLPDHPLPETQETPDAKSDLDLERWVATAPPGPVLAIGIRSPSEEALAIQLEPFHGRAIVGLDVHPGLGVNVVGDAHRLSQLFDVGSFAVVYSDSVLEHVAMPWVVALECARVLDNGGLAIHGTPWVWPTHAAPNDFWRFSPAGLTHLFTEALGFEVLETRSYGPARVFPEPSWRHGYVRMPTTTSNAGSWIVARKTGTPSGSADWPYDDDMGLAAAQRYPLDGLHTSRSEAT